MQPPSRPVALAAAIVAVVSTFGPLPAAAQERGRPAAERRNFVTCPIVRDTGTLPCWLAEYEGELYYLGSQGSSGSAFYPPQLGHKALIEGTVASSERICGGIPLVPVAVSVMTELDHSCDTVLPAEPQFESLPSPYAPLPSFDDGTREFTILYDFDSDYLTLHDTRIILEAVRVAKAVEPSHLEVRGYRGATLLSNGDTLTESELIGAVRARKMVEALVGLGIPRDTVRVTWQTEPEMPDGVTDPQQRRVTIALSSAP